MSTTIYILELEGGNFYVGKSQNPIKRFEEHLMGNGSFWTRKYIPLRIVKTIENASPFDEDRYVKEYMTMYGIDAVRGGTYINDILSDAEIEILQKEIRQATDSCIKCGKYGHFANQCKNNTNKCYRCDRSGHLEKNCYAKTDIKGYEIYDIFVCENCDREFDDEEKCLKHEKYCGHKNSDKCYRCGRIGHFVSACFANYHIKGYKI